MHCSFHYKLWQLKSICSSGWENLYFCQIATFSLLTWKLFQPICTKLQGDFCNLTKTRYSEWIKILWRHPAEMNAKTAEICSKMQRLAQIFDCNFKTVKITTRHISSLHVTACHVTSCHHVMSCHVMSCHVMSCHVTSRHVTSRHVTSRHVMSRHVTSRHVIPRYVTFRQFTSNISRHVTSRNVMSHNVT